MISVEIQNFQSVERVALNINGFTALLGQSNIGKSAVIRGIKAALTGSAGTAFVRHGANCARRLKKAKTCKCFSSVHLKGEGLDLLWEKGDSINRYTYNGQVYDRTDRGVPDFLADSFSMVKVGDKQELLQCSDQFHPIFLLNQTGGAIAEVLSDVAHLDRINVAMKLAEKDRREKTSIRKLREQDLVDLTKKIACFDTLDEVLEASQQVKNQLQDIVAVKATLAQLEQFVRVTTLLGGEVLRLRKVDKEVVPDTSSVQALENMLVQLGRFILEMGDREKTIRSLTGVSDILIPLTEELPGCFSLTERLEIFLSSMASKEAAVGSLTGVGKVEVPAIQENLTDSLHILGMLQDWASKLFSLAQGVQKKQAVEEVILEEPDNFLSLFDKWKALTQFQSRYQVLEIALEQLDKDSVVIQAEISSVEKEIEEIGVCPVCTRPVSEGLLCHE